MFKRVDYPVIMLYCVVFSCLPVHFIDLVMLHVIHGGDSIKLSEKSVKVI